MYRINTPADVANTGRVKIDAGEGVAIEVPTTPAEGATWATLPGKPATFPPSAHTHAQADVTGLVSALAGKAATSHTHTQAQVSGLTDALAGLRTIEPPTLAKGTNLNDVTTPGEHSQPFTTRATTELNYPAEEGESPVAGRLLVAANATRSQVTQFYIPFTVSFLGIWMRNFYSSWSTWERLPMSRDLAAKADATHPALYDSGWRDITSRVSGVASGRVLIRRTGSTVWVDFNDVLTTAPPANEWHTWTNFLPDGFGVFHDFTALPLAFTGARIGVRPETEPQVNPDTLYNSAQALGPVRFDLNRRAIIYGARTGDGTAALTVRGMVSFPTNDAIPATPPGSPS